MTSGNWQLAAENSLVTFSLADSPTKYHELGATMKRLSLLILLIPLCLALRLSAQEPAPDPDDQNLVDRPHAQDWITDIDRGWLTHEGDDPSWSTPTLDDSQWEFARLDDLGAAQPGWRWFRRHIKLSDNHPELSLLIQGGVGTYALYLNGSRMDVPELLSSLSVNRPTERAFTIPEGPTDLVIALRTHIPTGYAAWRFPQFMSVSLGTLDAVETARQSMYHDRTSYAIPAIVINTLMAFAGLALFALYSRQRGHAEYFWLGLYFLIIGTIDVIYYLQHSGFVPLVWNVGLADPVIYVAIIIQTRFTFAFGGHQLGRRWRIYQNLLTVPAVIPWLVWYGKIPSQTYMIIEPLIILPVAILLPILLFIWYRRGNREAGLARSPQPSPSHNPGSLRPRKCVNLFRLATLRIPREHPFHRPHRTRAQRPLQSPLLSQQPHRHLLPLLPCRSRSGSISSRHCRRSRNSAAAHP